MATLDLHILHRQSEIMMLDDDPIVCQVVGKHLADAGYSQFTWFTNVGQALSTILREPPDIILLDISMPNANGLNLLDVLRSDIELSDIAVIMVSAAYDEWSVGLSYELGAAEFLPKPVDAETLVAAINKVAKRKMRLAFGH